MSNYHILETTNNGDFIHVVFHVPVPDENNSVGYNIRDAIAEDPRFNDELGNRKKSKVPWIESSEQNDLDRGELFEHHAIFITNASIPFSTKQIQIDEMYLTLTEVIVNDLRLYYEFWRFARDVS